MEREIFISYSRHDIDKVKLIKDELEDTLHVECWMDLEGIESSHPNFVKAIVSGIVECKVFIFMLSKYSQTSNYALGEIDLAKNENKEIVFVNIDDCSLTREFRLVYGRSNILRWNNKSEHNKILRDLSRWLRREDLTVEPLSEPQRTTPKTEEPQADEEEDDLLYSFFKKFSNWNPIAEIRRIVYIFSRKILVRLRINKWMSATGLMIWHYWWLIIILILICLITFKHCSSQNSLDSDEESTSTIIQEEEEEDNEEKAFIRSLKLNYISSLPDSCFIPEIRDGLYGFSNPEGVLLIPCIWRLALPFTNGLAVVQEGNELFGFIDKTGKIAIPCIFKKAFPFSEGLARVQDHTTSLYGFIDCKGDSIVPCQWDLAGDFVEGLALVQDDNELFGFIDKTGKVVIPCLWPSANSFSEGLALVQGEGWKYGYIDKSGKNVIPCQWTYAEGFEDERAAVQDEEGRWLTIDKKGRIISTQ